MPAIFTTSETLQRDGKILIKQVVDSNFLQGEALRAYLSESPHHYVVMTDYAFMEAYKADTLDMLYRSMEIPSQYPKQVIVLKGTQTVRLLSGRPAPREVSVHAGGGVFGSLGS